MSTTKVTVTTVRDFFDHSEGKWVESGESLSVERARAVELQTNGLIDPFEAKAAEEPENKEAPKPANKARTGKADKAEKSEETPPADQPPQE